MPSETMRPDAQNAPRVGVPWRSAKEEDARNLAKIQHYYSAIEAAGGLVVPISLRLPVAELERLARTLDALVLPGSPADVDPANYGAGRHAACAEPDPRRERTDYVLLDHALAASKPVLAVCYGTQLLNVYLGGTLIQDIASELGTQIRHDKNGLPAGAADPHHAARVEDGSKLAELAGGAVAEVNSSHHQAVLAAGRDLRVTARAPDGVIEAVEWTGDANWIVGVQWHPERMPPGDPLSASLFRELLAAARAATARS